MLIPLLDLLQKKIKRDSITMVKKINAKDIKGNAPAENNSCNNKITIKIKEVLVATRVETLKPPLADFSLYM